MQIIRRIYISETMKNRNVYKVPKLFLYNADTFTDMISFFDFVNGCCCIIGIAYYAFAV